MRKHKITALLLCAAMALTAAAGCSGKESSSSSSASQPYKISTDGKQDGLADNVINAGLTETAKANDTGYTLTKVIDSGMRTDKNEHYIYLEVTVDNQTDKEYELNAINNFYILFADGSEAHYDIRTQLYAGKHMSGFVASPFTVPANGKFSGIIGGFLVGDEINEFTVCFFPTLDDERNKDDVIKVKVKKEEIVVMTAAG